MKFIQLFFFVVCSYSMLSAQQQEIDTLRYLQDNRTAPVESIIPFLSSLHSKIREQALLAIANRQDKSVINKVALLLNDIDKNARRMAAFTLGQIGDSSAFLFLMKRLEFETESDCRKEIFHALGMSGNASDLRTIIASKFAQERKNNSHLALSIARFANRGIKDSLAAEFLFRDSALTKNAVYAIMRIANAGVNEIHREKIFRLLKSRDPEMRMWAVSILGTIKDSSAKILAIKSAAADKDWRVRVNALRALRNFPDGNVISILQKSVYDKNDHVSLTALSVISQLPAIEKLGIDSAFIAKIFFNKKSYNPLQRGEAAVILAKLFNHNAMQMLENEFSNANVTLKIKIIESFGFLTPSMQTIKFFQQSLESENSGIAIAAIEAYQKHASRMDAAAQNYFCEDIVKLLPRNDAGISYSVAVAFQDSALKTAIRKKYLSQLRGAFSAMKGNDDVEPMIELMKVFSEFNDTLSIPLLEKLLSDSEQIIRRQSKIALKKITGKDYEEENISQRNKPNKSLTDLAKYSGAIIKTTKGEIRVRFLSDASPFTVQSFIELVQQSFYRNLLFHRVVSNFVIQGGDPLGNGSGGPGYTIRTEVHPNARYDEAGKIGMASAGKDTEGSQFFITHCSTPHLDGRYTIFAETNNVDVINKIMIGDTIKEIVLFEK